METDLYKFESKNILIYLSYFSCFRKRAENYYFFINQYKKFTSDYLNNITLLLESANPLLKDIKNNNFMDIEMNDNEDNFSKENELDLSPLDKITSLICEELQKQIDSLKFFLQNIELSLDNFKVIINQTKLEVENKKNECLSLSDKFSEYISITKKENENLINDISLMEEKIIKYYFMNLKLVNNANYNNIKKQNEDELNKQIKELKEKENAYLEKENNKLKNYKDFNDKMENYCQQIKNNTFLLFKIFKLSANSFSNYLLSCFNLNKDKIIHNGNKTKKVKKNEQLSELELCINKNLKSINNNTIKLSLIQTRPKLYIPKVIQTKAIDITKEIFIILKKEINNLDIHDIIINSEDRIYIMEKLNQFDLIDKDKYNLEKEKNKILISEIMKKVLFMSEKVEENYEKILEEESFKLNEFIERDSIYRYHFLFALGYYRSNNTIQLSPKLFDIISKIFFFISDMVLKEKDFDTECNLIILSQTFYKMDKDKKIYLYARIKDHKLFRSEDIWIDYIKYQISLEVKNKVFYDDKMGEKIEKNKKDFNQRNNQIIFSQLVNANQNMKNLELDDNKINNILNILLNHYNILSPKTKEDILNFINMKSL